MNSAAAGSAGVRSDRDAAVRSDGEHRCPRRARLTAGCGEQSRLRAAAEELEGLREEVIALRAQLLEAVAMREEALAVSNRSQNAPQRSSACGQDGAAFCDRGAGRRSRARALAMEEGEALRRGEAHRHEAELQARDSLVHALRMQVFPPPPCSSPPSIHPFAFHPPSIYFFAPSPCLHRYHQNPLLRQRGAWQRTG